MTKCATCSAAPESVQELMKINDRYDPSDMIDLLTDLSNDKNLHEKDRVTITAHIHLLTAMQRQRVTDLLEKIPA